MATHSSTLAWKIPWMEEPSRLQSMGSLRVGHDWATSLLLFTFMHWRRQWQPTPVFLPGESQGWESLVGCRLWGRRVGHDWSDLAAAAAATAADMGDGRHPWAWGSRQWGRDEEENWGIIYRNRESGDEGQGSAGCEVSYQFVLIESLRTHIIWIQLRRQWNTKNAFTNGR